MKPQLLFGVFAAFVFSACSGETTNCGPLTCSDAGNGSGADTSNGGLEASCTQLSTCCPGFPPDRRTPCEALVTLNDARRCADNYIDFNTAGLCDGPYDGGVGADAAAGQGPRCSDLSDCCATLPMSSQPGCQAIVVLNDEDNCRMTLEGLNAVCS